MARTVTVALVDDLTGAQADETVLFSIDGKSYEIDLASGNAERLREVMAEYVAAARKPDNRKNEPRAVRASRSTADRDRNQAIREWASQRGIELSERGRIPKEVIESYDQEN
jgi:Lsr2